MSYGSGTKTQWRSGTRPCSSSSVQSTGKSVCFRPPVVLEGVLGCKVALWSSTAVKVGAVAKAEAAAKAGAAAEAKAGRFSPPNYIVFLCRPQICLCREVDVLAGPATDQSHPHSAMPEGMTAASCSHTLTSDVVQEYVTAETSVCRRYRRKSPGRAQAR